MSGPKLRRATRADRAALRKLVTDFHQEEALETTQAHRDGALDPLLDGLPHAEVYVLAQEQELLGYAIFSLGWSIELGGLDAFLDELYVRPGDRNRGLGQRLLTETKDLLAGRSIANLCLEVDTSNAGAVALYHRLGFKDRARYQLMD
ncbi:MAG: GNAT family N-acetyltransferase [Pseudomonadota bacterium]